MHPRLATIGTLAWPFGPRGGRILKCTKCRFGQYLTSELFMDANRISEKEYLRRKLSELQFPSSRQNEIVNCWITIANSLNKVNMVIQKCSKFVRNFKSFAF